MTAVTVVLPPGVDDGAVPSGGNRFDRRLCDGLAALGWAVRERVVPGAWPRPDDAAIAGLAAALAEEPDGGLVLLDGLVASAVPEVLAAVAARLRLVGLVHMPQPDGAVDRTTEARALAAMRAVLVPSDWTRRRLVEEEGVPAVRVHVAPPGVDPAPPATGTPTGGSLLAVGAVVPHKGHDLLLDALHRIRGLDWRCTIAGSLDRAPAFAAGLRRAAEGFGGRVVLPGVLTGDRLAAAYAAADLLVLPSRAESFGLVVLEALAAGVPVLAADVGGVPEALGDEVPDRPGLLVAPGDPAALTAALRAWLTDAGLRARLRGAAAARRRALPGWDRTARVVAEALASA